ncbi:pickpocket protein 19 [Sergentomyia squamirostris]
MNCNMVTLPVKSVHPDGKSGKMEVKKIVKRVRWRNAWWVAEENTIVPVQQKKIPNDDVGDKDNIFIRYCDNTTIHGIRYLSHRGLHWTERLFWSLIVCLATIGTVYVCILLSQRYRTSPLSTVVENTNYHISEISYPAVSICNTHRINTNKIEEAVKIYLPNGTEEDLENFGLLLDALEVLDFGSYEEFDSLVGRNLSGLMHINLTELAINLRYSCLEVFENHCWWRSRYINCCDIFKLQKSEYGICYSFNSASNEETPLNTSQRNLLWRTTSFNEWSGFRGIIKSHPGIKQRYKYPPGVLVIVHHPFEWPQQAKFIPAGTTTAIGIQPTTFYASSDVRRLKFTERQCIYNEEANSNPDQVMTLQSLPYMRQNCMSECRQRYLLSYCNCTIDFFFPSGKTPPVCPTLPHKIPNHCINELLSVA